MSASRLRALLVLLLLVLLGATAQAATRAGTNRADTLRGTGGKDVLSGRGSSDVLFGRALLVETRLGDDRLLDGGPGGDTIRSIGGSRDVVDCGPGRDRIAKDSCDVTRNCEVVL